MENGNNDSEVVNNVLKNEVSKKYRKSFFKSILETFEILIFLVLVFLAIVVVGAFVIGIIMLFITLIENPISLAIICVTIGIFILWSMR